MSTIEEAMAYLKQYNDADAYQYLAKQTAIYPEKYKLIYPALGLGEAGEFQGKVKKILRDSGGQITPEIRDALLSELGDVVWYVSACASDLDAPLSDVLIRNVEKLFDRKERGVLGGSGDNR